jgi:ribosomal protein S18 acetylase RimI-like enzyme
MFERIKTLDQSRIEPLVAASQREGFRFLARLREEWLNGTNRFELAGEGLFGLATGEGLIGIGGINRQDESTGRLRHFYILPSQRRRGWGGRLLRHILEDAARHYRWLVLRTDTEAADCFYRACGFARLGESENPTHRLDLARIDIAAAGQHVPGRRLNIRSAEASGDAAGTG